MELDIKQISLFIVIFSQLILMSECVNSSVIEEIYNSIKNLPEYEQLGKYLSVLALCTVKRSLVSSHEPTDDKHGPFQSNVDKS